MIAVPGALLVAIGIISMIAIALHWARDESPTMTIALSLQAIGACSPVLGGYESDDERVPCREVVSLPSKGSDVAILSLEDRDGQDCACFVDPPEANASIAMTFDADACACAGVYVGSQPGRLRLEGDCEAP